jgi:hypothetical protein
MSESFQQSESQTEGTTAAPAKMGRKWLSGCLVLFLAALAGAGYMLWTVQQVPEFYRQAAAQVADPDERAAAAAEFANKIETLQVSVRQSAEWSETFSQDEINSWLEQEAQRNPEILPDGVHRPLIVVEDGRFQLGVEVNWEDWRGIISLEAVATATGPREIQFRLLHVRLGRLDIAMDEVRNRVKPQIEANQSEEYRATWVDTPDGPVIQVELTNEESAHLGLSAIKLSQGRLTVQGVNSQAESAEGDDDQRP